MSYGEDLDLGYNGSHRAMINMGDTAHQFLLDAGIEPTPDAVGQLLNVFVPCLRIMCERPYNPAGETWRAHGWRGCLFHAKGKMERLWEMAWRQGTYHNDSAFDAINFLGFYLRSQEDPPWGTWGEPG
jgi:hypothetical protein